MSKAPFYKVFIGKDTPTDISDFVESFKFEDCVGEDSMVTITLYPEKVIAFQDKFNKLTGTLLTFEFGYLGVESSGFRKARITDTSRNYAERITVTITALTHGTVMRKSSGNKVWTNKTTKEILSEIAQNYDLTVESPINGRLHKSLPQKNLSDWEFIQQLVAKEDNGDYICYVKDTSLIMESRGLDKKSVRTFTYKDPDGVVVSFTPKDKESTAKKDSISSTSVSTNPKTGATEIVKSDRTDSVALDKFITLYDGNANIIGQKKIQGQVTPAPSSAANADKAKSSVKAGALEQDTASLVTLGDPSAKANVIITIGGVFKQDAGNWWVHKVVHSIQGSTYTTTRALGRNAAKVGTAPATNGVNTSVGDTKTTSPNTVRIGVYNANADRLTDKQVTQ